MQFRDQGKRTQVLAYRGYDKDKKRAIIKLLGSYDRFDFTMSDGLEESLTDGEKEDLQSHIETIRLYANQSMLQYKVSEIASRITEVSDCITDAPYDSIVTQEYANSVYGAIDRLTKALRRKGFKRPPRGAHLTHRAIRDFYQTGNEQPISADPAETSTP